MSKGLLNKVLFLSFYINIIFLLLPLLIFILAIIDSDIVFNYLFHRHHEIVFQLINSAITIPVIFLWVYNIWFAYKYDKYSKATFLLMVFSFVYSPYYFYQIKIKKKPLKNEIAEVPVPGNIIQMEDYSDESEFEKDLKHN